MSQDYKDLPKSWNSCRCCGFQPKKAQGPNLGPIRYWECDDGWLISTLCRDCYEELAWRKPKKTDYAYQFTNEFCDQVETDEDPTIGILAAAVAAEKNSD